MSARLPGISRRRFIASAGLATTAVCLVPHRMFGGEESLVVAARKSGEAANVTVRALRGNVSALIGAGGNIAVFPGNDGKLIIDAGYLSARSKIAAALSSLTPDPIKHLINTHWHFDHTDGNEWMHSAGATITAHENTRKHLSTSTRVEDWNFTFPPSPAGAIPTDVFNTDKTLQLNGATIVLKHYGPAHTDGDISAYFVEADVFHTGDTWWNGYYPFIDCSTGGNVNGMIKAAEANLAMVTDKTVVVPGHGSVGGKSEMIEYRNVLATIRERIAALKGEGKSLDEIVAAKPTAAYDAKWGKGFVNGEFFTKLVYKGVEKGTP
ncbi:MAG TPA: MBL fold metallo-hydrolase [Chthoniobacterales bacterium]|jgi:glyoxylase-like metal-dependent hydrolase (beta-lactamase superfamily II)|nr:MBL fold metallo-hydrolase [Chthoniobacterales bacterium]